MKERKISGTTVKFDDLKGIPCEMIMILKEAREFEDAKRDLEIALERYVAKKNGDESLKDSTVSYPLYDILINIFGVSDPENFLEENGIL